MENAIAVLRTKCQKSRKSQIAKRFRVEKLSEQMKCRSEESLPAPLRRVVRRLRPLVPDLGRARLPALRLVPLPARPRLAGSPPRPVAVLELSAPPVEETSL